MIDKINRIFCCEYVLIDETDYYTKRDGASLEQVAYTFRFPKGAWAMDLERYDNAYTKIYRAFRTKPGYIGGATISVGFLINADPAPAPTFEAVLITSSVSQALDELNGEVIQTTIIDKIDGAKTSKEDIRQAIITKGVAVGLDVPLSDYDDKIAAIGGSVDYLVQYVPSLTVIEQGTQPCGVPLTVDVPDPVSGTTLPLLKTGQTTSYRTGDDGDLEEGRGADFFTLSENNFFGNLQRFTSIIGGYYDQGAGAYKTVAGAPSDFATQFADKIMIDWQTYDQSSGAVNMYYMNFPDQRTFENYVDWALALSHGGFSDWRGANANELLSLINYQFALMYSWYPWINITGAQDWYMSTTTIAHNTGYVWAVQSGVFPLSFRLKGSDVGFCIAVRTGNISEL
jgi:hypothetical protein